MGIVVSVMFGFIVCCVVCDDDVMNKLLVLYFVYVDVCVFLFWMLFFIIDVFLDDMVDIIFDYCIGVDFVCVECVCMRLFSFARRSERRWRDVFARDFGV